MEKDPYLKIEIADLVVDQGDRRGIDLYIDIMDNADTVQARREAYQHLTDRVETRLPFDEKISHRDNDDQISPFKSLSTLRQ